MAQVRGKCDPKFENVRAKFQRLLESGEELGASLAVISDGEDVLNIWGGFADADRTRPWNEDTIVNVFSSTKTVTALAMLLLINDGEISPNDKVSKYWPEFAVNGKEDVEVRHLLSHTSGLAIFEDPGEMDFLCDLKLCTSRLEKQPPRWTPGTASGYHSWTYGFPIGELIRRKTGLSLTEFVAQRIAGPTGADLQIGAKEEDWPRIAELVPPPPFIPPGIELLPPDSIPVKMLNPTPDASFANTPTWRKAEIGSANGHTNAKGLAKVWSDAVTLSNESKRLLSNQTVDLIFKEQSYGTDLAIGQTVRFGLGMSIRGNGDAIIDSWVPEGRLCYWGGWGGSMIINDVDRHITIAYVMNKMGPGIAGNDAVKQYVAEIYQALGVSLP